VRGSAAEVRGIDRALSAHQQSDSPTDGPGDDELSRWSFRRRRNVRTDQRQSRLGALVSLTQESRATDPRSSSRGDSYRSGRADVGACSGRPCGASRTVHRGRPAAVSDGPRAAVPNAGPPPPQDHAQGAIQEESAVTAGRVGAALSRITENLAVSRIVVLKSNVPICGSIHARAF
jgi:hypothetical protein